MGKGSPRAEKARTRRSKIKVKLVVFYDWKGIFNHEFVRRGQMVNRQFYKEALVRLRDAVYRKRPEMWENQTWKLHQGNTPGHAYLLRSYLPKYQTSAVTHPPYSPDLAPADFFLFPKLKTTLKRRRFQTIEEIQENSIRKLRAITENVFQEAFQQWKRRWERCIASRGD